MFISALIGILQHWRILPIFIRVIGTLLSKVNGMGKLESFNAVSSLILGQSENFIAYKGVLGDLSSRRLFTMAAATAMSTVSLSIVGAYMTMLDAKYVVAALILNMFSTFIVLSVINPTRPGSEQEIKLEKLHESQSFFEMLGEYILAGFKVAMIILAMLIGFIALISAINALFATLFGLSFQQILGYVFYPLAWLIGIPLSDALNAGSIMATKLVANEFVAMIELQKIAASMTPRGLGILSVFTVSFANFASIGIIAGAIKGLNEPQGNIVSRFGLRLVYKRHAGKPAFRQLRRARAVKQTAGLPRRLLRTARRPAGRHASPTPARSVIYSHGAEPQYPPRSARHAHGSPSAPCSAPAPPDHSGQATGRGHQTPSARRESAA